MHILLFYFYPLLKTLACCWKCILLILESVTTLIIFLAALWITQKTITRSQKDN